MGISGHHPGHRQRCRNQGAVSGLRGAGCGAYSTLNLKNAALSSGANSRQMVPSTTDTESGFLADELHWPSRERITPALCFVFSINCGSCIFENTLIRNRRSVPEKRHTSQAGA